MDEQKTLRDSRDSVKAVRGGFAAASKLSEQSPESRRGVDEKRGGIDFGGYVSVRNSTVGGPGRRPALVPRLISSFTACWPFSP